VGAGASGRGYYSYNRGAWHIISLNSNIAAQAGSAQEQWLRADLAANPTLCTLAYWRSTGSRLAASRRDASDARDVRCSNVLRPVSASGASVTGNSDVLCAIPAS